MHARIAGVIAAILVTPASANTFFYYNGVDGCITRGDNDIYGPGVRAGFYLQWIASLLALLFAPTQYSGSRVAGVAVLWAILICSLNSTIYFNYPNPERDAYFTIPVFEWTIVFYLTIGLFATNLPIDKAQMAKTAGAWVASAFAGCVAMGASFHLYWTDLHERGDLTKTTQYAAFANHADQLASKGCGVNVAFLASFSAYSNGWVTFNKVISVIACVIYIPLFAIFAIRLLYFNLRYGGSQTEDLPAATGSNMMRYIVAVLTFISGMVSIISVEVMISKQKIDFGPTPFFSSIAGLASVFVGLICFFSIVWEIAQKRFGRNLVGGAPPPPDFWSAKAAIRMTRLKK